MFSDSVFKSNQRIVSCMHRIEQKSQKQLTLLLILLLFFSHNRIRSVLYATNCMIILFILKELRKIQFLAEIEGAFAAHSYSLTCLLRPLFASLQSLSKCIVVCLGDFSILLFGKSFQCFGTFNPLFTENQKQSIFVL